MAPLSAARRAATAALLGAATRTAASAVARRASTSTQVLTHATPLFPADATIPAAKPIQTVRSATQQIAASLGHAATTTIGRRAVSCLASLPHSATRTCAFSSSSIMLGNRSLLSAPIHLATSGSMISKRGIASQSEAFTPELKQQLQRMEEASEARHRELTKKFADFQASVKKDFALLEVAKANSVTQNARVAWGAFWGSLPPALLGIWYVLHTKSMWIRDFKITVLCMLTELVAILKIDLEEQVKTIVREEMEKKE